MPLKPSIFRPLNDWVMKHFGKDTSKMLIITGIVGWAMSAAAQIFAIIINDKIPKKQKMFLIPQEAADAAVNILSFYAVTQSFKSISSVLVKSGKWLPKSIKTILETKGLTDKIGKPGFDVLKNADLSQSALNRVESFKNGIEVLATTAGSILSCNIITPLIRNEIAAHRQKKSIARMEVSTKPVQKVQYSTLKRPTMSEFYRGSGLKI